MRWNGDGGAWWVGGGGKDLECISLRGEGGDPSDGGS